MKTKTCSKCKNSLDESAFWGGKDGICRGCTVFSQEKKTCCEKCKRIIDNGEEGGTECCGIRACPCHQPQPRDMLGNTVEDLNKIAREVNEEQRKLMEQSPDSWEEKLNSILQEFLPEDYFAGKLSLTNELKKLFTKAREEGYKDAEGPP